MDRKLRRWELALMLGAALALVLGAWLGGEQRSLAGRVVRLHVIANSDSARDQALKLAVRDGVLSRAEALYPPEATLDQARAALADHLDELAAAGQAVVDAQGGTDRVTAQLTRCWFPTKTYDGFALPAGEYEALRVVIGDGRGQNWWCVAYPPLCLGAASRPGGAIHLRPGQIGHRGLRALCVKIQRDGAAGQAGGAVFLIETMGFSLCWT